MKPFEVDWDDEHVCVLARLALARQCGGEHEFLCRKNLQKDIKGY
jgi:hypothetical protein